MNNKNALILIIVSLLNFSLACASLSQAKVSPEQLRTGLTIIVEEVTILSVQSSIEVYGDNAKRAWRLVQMSLKDFLVPILDGGRIRIADLNAWLNDMSIGNNIPTGIVKAINLIVNICLGFIPTDHIGDSVKGNPNAELAYDLIVAGLKSFVETIEYELK